MAAINRVKWAGSGLQLAAGDDEGYIYIYDVGEVCSLIFPYRKKRKFLLCYVSEKMSILTQPFRLIHLFARLFNHVLIHLFS